MKNILFRLTALALLLLIGLMVWMFFFPHSSGSDGAVELDEARNVCPIRLPDSAENIRHISYRYFVAHEELVRFEAPPKDCLAHIDAVISDWKKAHLDPPSRQVGPVEKIKSPPGGIDSDLEDTAWFDIENISNGLHAGGGPSVPEFWIDLDRGVFYYRMKD